MHRILVDYARHKAEQRGAGLQGVEMQEEADRFGGKF